MKIWKGIELEVFSLRIEQYSLQNQEIEKKFGEMLIAD